LRTAPSHDVAEEAAGRGARRRKAIALSVAQALPVLERAQLFRQRDAHVAVGPDRHAPTAGGEAFDQALQFAGIDGAQRMRGDAENGTLQPLRVPRARLHQPAKAVEIRKKARLPRLCRARPAPAVRVE
jgi:hypothetical protein